MKHTLLLMTAIVLAVTLLSGSSAPVQVQAAPTDLFFSEYVEGSANNQAIEIYNGTGSPINLAAGGYEVVIFHSCDFGLLIPLTGTIASGDVFVLAHSLADPTILNQADQLVSGDWFDGNDEIHLDNATETLDIIGSICQGVEWGTGLASTQDNTLRRKTSIETGDTNPLDIFNPATEWDGFAVDTFDGLGSHTIGSEDNNFVYLPLVLNNDKSGMDWLISPQNGAVLNTLIPSFEWNTGFPTEGKSACMAIESTPHPGCSSFYWVGSFPHRFENMWYNLSPSTVYYWRVGVEDPGGSSYTWSNEWTFTTGPAGGTTSSPPASIPDQGQYCHNTLGHFFLAARRRICRIHALSQRP